MNSDWLRIVSVALAALALGAGVTYFAVRTPTVQQERTGAPLPQAAIFSGLSDTDLDAAINLARAQRAAGKLTPVATTPEEFARALGALNYRLHAFSGQYAELPAMGSAGRAAYEAELATLTGDLANLLSDDELMLRLDDDSPATLAHHQAWLAAGSLDLDEATTDKVEDILAKGYAAAMPDGVSDPLTPEEDADLDVNLEAMIQAAADQIASLLTPVQKARLDALGIEQVIFGLMGD